MTTAATALHAKLAQNSIGTDNEWTDEYVNSVIPSEGFWRQVAARKPPECAGIIARFGQYVQASDGCWLWTGSRTGSWKGGQHGQFALYHGENIYAHRLSFLLFHGPIPEGAVVRHSCDVGYCVKPSHLLAGTQKDNLQDAVARHRLPKVRAYRKVSPDQVIAIRRERMRGTTLRELAGQYGVSKAYVSLLCSLARRTELHAPEWRDGAGRTAYTKGATPRPRHASGSGA